MGLRYRKSINLGGGFRVNLSKSGVGYSWGTKGYRITHTSKGNIRRTASIPGTGISWIEENRKNPTKKNLNNKTPQQSFSASNNYYDTINITNNITKDTISEGLSSIVTIAERTIVLNKAINILICLSLLGSLLATWWIALLLVAFLFKIIVRTKGLVNLEYTIDNDQLQLVDDRMNQVRKIKDCDKVWRIVQSNKVINTKYSSGASSTVLREPCIASSKIPFPFKTNTQVISFIHKNETLIFLPDKLFIIKKNKIGVLDYNDFNEELGTSRFIEDNIVPKDATIIDQTWEYVNKSGGPDRRFKNNKQLPVCLYGTLKLSSNNGLNTKIMFSRK